jgi:hypothetical protein
VTSIGRYSERGRDRNCKTFRHGEGLASVCGFKRDSRSHAASRWLPKQNIENNPMQSTRQLPGRTLWAINT